jgi:hypothetical protein
MELDDPTTGEGQNLREDAARQTEEAQIDAQSNGGGGGSTDGRDDDSARAAAGAEDVESAISPSAPHSSSPP